MTPTTTWSLRTLLTALAAGALLLSLSAIAQSAGEPAADGVDLSRRSGAVEAQGLHSRIEPERGGPLLIVDQFAPSALVGQAPSQVFPDDPAQDTLLFDEIHLTRPWQIGQLFVYGVETGNPGCNQAVIGQIWQGRPGDGGAPVMTANGNQVGNDLVVNFGGQVLPPGDYLVDAHVIRPQAGGCPGGQWFAQVRELGSSEEVGMWRPNQPGEAGNVTDVLLTSAPPLDLMFQLEGMLDDFQDCNGNLVDDYLDILNGDSWDTDGNGVPDECQRDGLAGPADFDLDGIPDASDTQPQVYAPETGALPSGVTVNQLSFLATDYDQSAALTEYGAVTITYPTTSDVHLYVNIEVDGQWVVQNSVTYTSEDSTDAPTQSETYFIDLGNPRGVAVNSVTVRWWVDPIGLAARPPGIGPVIPVTEATYRVGDVDGGVGDGEPVPAPGPGGVAPAPSPMGTKTTYENKEITVADMKWWFQVNSCGPNSVGGSFAWLANTYLLSLPAGFMTVEDFVQEFRRLMNTFLGAGTTTAEMKTAKEGFIRKYKLPLYVTSGPATPENIAEEMRKGQDVEIVYGKYRQDGPGGTWVRHGGHAVAIKKITKCVKNGVTSWQITFVHDWSQDACGGVACVPVTVTSESLDLDNDGSTESHPEIHSPLFGGGAATHRIPETFLAECPTQSAILDAMKRLLTAYSGAADLAKSDGDVDLEESKDLLKQLRRIRALAERAAEIQAARWGDGPTLNALNRIIQSTTNGIAKLEKRIKSLGGKSGSRSVLPEDIGDLLVLEGTSMVTQDIPVAEAFLAPDADLDDIKDGVDNAPVDANYDQADQNSNGTADVLELGPATDCNDNGVVDVYEVTIAGIIGWNPDGTPIIGFPYDLDGNLIPDQCETAPPTECLADLNGDMKVDVLDFAILAANFGTAVQPGKNGDFDLDGMVTIFDFAIFAGEFGCVP